MNDACRNLAGDVAAGRLSKEELDDLLGDLRKERKRLMAGPALESVEAGIMARGRLIAEESALAAAIEKRNHYINVMVEAKLMDAAQRADDAMGKPVLGIQAALVGVNTPIAGAQRSVDNLSQGMWTGWAGGMIADLTRGKVYTQFLNMKGKFEEEVADALSDLNMPKPTGSGAASADAKAIAKIMHKYQRASVERRNRGGAYIRNLPGYVTRQTHNAAKMVRAGAKAWKDEIRPRLDFEKMDIAPDGIEGFLSSAYSAMKSGVRLDKPLNDLSKAFTGPGNLAKKISASRVLAFKTPRDALAYDKAFGTGSLREAFMADLQHAAQSAALMTNFGTNPQAMLDRVTRQLEKKYRDDDAKLNGLRGGLENLQHQMDEVSGDINIGPATKLSHLMADAGRVSRAWQSMSKLGSAVISSTVDIASMATNRIYQGRSMMDAWGDALSAPVAGLSGGEKREFADMLGAGLGGALGGFMSRFNANDTVPGRVSKAMQLFFKLNLQGPWTDAMQRGATMMVSRDLALNAGKALADLPPDMQRMLSLYGIDARQWEVARLAVRVGNDGRSYIMPGDVADVTGSPFTGLTMSQQDKLRDEVRDNLFALMSGEADFTVPTPGARERAIMRRGLRAGTGAGEAFRFFWQFKSFGIVSLTKVLGRQMYGHGAKTKREQLMRGGGANLGLVNAIVGTTVMGYFVMQTKELMKGREMRPNDLKAFGAAMLQGGGLGIYGDFLFGQANRFGGGALQTAAGPVVSDIASAFDLFQRARGVVEGGSADLSGDALRLAKSNIPFANLFYAKGAMDYLIWFQLQEAMNPGYLKRMERRVATQNKQKYWLPPSSIVATGGGFR